MGFRTRLMKFLAQLRKYLSGNGGCKCLECGFYSESWKEDWYDGGKVKLGGGAIARVCPQCGGEKTVTGIRVTRVDSHQEG